MRRLFRDYKIILFALLLALLYSNCLAGESENRRVTSFDGIKVIGKINLYLKEGRDEALKVEVEGVELDEVLSDVSGNTLTVRMKPGFLREDYDVKVWVTYRKIRDLHVSASARLYGQSVLGGDMLTVKATTSGLAELEVDINNLEIDAESTGELTIKGRAQTQETAVNTGGKLHAFDLQCDNVYIKVTTGGAGRVTALKLIEASVTTAGSLRYKGNPSKKSIKKSTGGSVSEILE